MKGATTLSIKGMYVDTQHNNAQPLCWRSVSRYFITMLKVIRLSVMAPNKEEEEKFYLVSRHSQSPRFSLSSTSGNNLITHICSSLKLPT